MSANLSDSQDDSPEPRGPTNLWVRFLMWAVVAPLLYVLSTGPMYWLAARGYLPGELVLILYFPLFWFFGADFTDLMVRYVHWWVP